MTTCGSLLLLAVVRSFPVATSGVQYRIIDIGALCPWPQCQAQGINDSGVVVGTSIRAGGLPFQWSPSGGFRWIGPIMSIRGQKEARSVNNSGYITGYTSWGGSRRAFLSVPGFGLKSLGVLRPPGYSEGYAINDNGQVAGTTFHDNGIDIEQQAFIWTPQTGMIGIPPLETGGMSGGQGLNDSGVVVGHASLLQAGVHNPHPFRWTAQNGTQYLGLLPGCISGEASAVNSSGQIIGHCIAANFNRVAFIWTEAQGMIDLGINGAPLDINDNGQVVGSSAFKGFSYHPKTGFIWLNDHLDQASQGWNLTIASSVNNRGWIAGTGAINGEDHAFVAVPH